MHETIYFWNPYDKTNNLTHVELSRSITAILDMPQYNIMEYQKTVAYALLSLSIKYLIFNKYRTIMPLCLTALVIVIILYVRFSEDSTYYHVVTISFGQFFTKIIHVDEG